MSVGEAVRWKLPSLDGADIEISVEQPAEADVVPDVPAPDVQVPTSVFDLGPASGGQPSDDTPATNGPQDDAESGTADPVAEHAAVLEAERAAAREAGHAEGYATGHAEGLTAGTAQGQADALAQCEGDVAALRELLAYLATPLEQQDSALEDELVTLSMAIARQLVRRELQTAPGEIVPVVREALAVLPSAQRDITVSLHPDDAALVRSALSGNAEADAWQLSEDPLLSRGGCRIAAGHSHVDATLEARLNAVAMALSTRSRSDD